MSEADPADRAARLQIIGIVTMGIGIFGVLMLTAVAVAHFGWRVPVYHRHTRDLEPEDSVIRLLLIFAVMSVGAIAAGSRMRRAARKLLDEN